MFIEGENIILKNGGQYKVLAVSFEKMSVMASNSNRKLGFALVDISWDDIRVNENRAIEIKEYKRRRKIDNIMK